MTFEVGDRVRIRRKGGVAGSAKWSTAIYEIIARYACMLKTSLLRPEHKFEYKERIEKIILSE